MINLTGVECFAVVGAVVTLKFTVDFVIAVFQEIKRRTAFRCPKCKTIHRSMDRFCRMCGYELDGLAGWIRRNEGKNE